MDANPDRSLRVLIIEDSDDDAFLMVRELERAGYNLSYRRVETAAALADAIASQTWDIIFADYTMPHFSGTQALAITRRSGLDVPLVLSFGNHRRGHGGRSDALGRAGLHHEGQHQAPVACRRARAARCRGPA